MKTKIITSKGSIQLGYLDPTTKKYNILASMTLYEGTGCWVLMDIRLSQHTTPSPYSGSPSADDMWSEWKPGSPEEADFIKSKLRECHEEPDGALWWCTFNGIVRGSASVKGYTPHNRFNQAGYFGRSAGLAELKKAQEFWDGFTGDPATVRLPNVNAQPSLTNLHFAWKERKLELKMQAERLAKIEAEQQELRGSASPAVSPKSQKRL